MTAPAIVECAIVKGRQPDRLSPVEGEHGDAVLAGVTRPGPACRG